MRLPAASALASFLAGPTVQLPRAVVCIGNDAGDIDSLASALGLAVVLQQRQPDALYVPCAPFARRDFRLRQDASLLFGHCASLDDAGAPAELMHLDDLGGGAASWRDADSLTVALTDHNVCLPGVTEAVGGAPVAAIVDHHNDEAKHVDTAALREVDPAVGSCCSLIVEMADAATLGGALGVLLLGAIAIDTRGFDPTLLGTKYNGRDLAAGRKLLAALGGEPLPASLDLDDELDVAVALRAAALPEVARVAGAATVEALNVVLLGARYDVGGLSAAELLRLDYKEAVAGGATVGIAAICVTRSELLTRSGGGVGLAEAMGAAAAARGVDVLFALTAEDPTEEGLKSLVAVCSTKADGSGLGQALLGGLAGIPSLPPRLAEQPLFAAQGIPTLGFGISWAGVDGGGASAEVEAGSGALTGLRMSRLRAEATRKTLMPAMVHFCEAR